MTESRGGIVAMIARICASRWAPPTITCSLVGKYRKNVVCETPAASAIYSTVVLA